MPEPSSPVRESMAYDVVIVGGGPAGPPPTITTS